MHPLSSLTAALAILLLAGCAASGPIAYVGGTQLPQTFRRQVRQVQQLNYLLALPTGFETGTDQRWPLVLFLHGAGESGTNLNAVALHGPPKFARDGRPLPYILVSPQCPAGRVWNTEELLGLLDDVSARLPVDTRRVYVTGLSMGGYGTWMLAARAPERFAAVVPICGGGDRVLTRLYNDAQKAAVKTLGIRAYHGARDNVVPLEESQRMIAAFKRAGNDGADLIVYPDAGHDSWTQAYDDPALWQWMLARSR
jgi:predicted peptidase